MQCPRTPKRETKGERPEGEDQRCSAIIKKRRSVPSRSLIRERGSSQRKRNWSGKKGVPGGKNHPARSEKFSVNLVRSHADITNATSSKMKKG